MPKNAHSVPGTSAVIDGSVGSSRVKTSVTSAKATATVWGIMTCGSTRKALAFIELQSRTAPEFKDLKTVTPPKALLEQAMKSLDNPRKLFNVTGASYRDGGFRERAATMKKDEIVAALMADPMLIKRPIVRTDKGVTVGFDETRIASLL